MDDYDLNYRSDDMQYFDIYEPGANEIFETCVWPTLTQITNYMITFFLWNIAFKVATQSGKFNSFKHAFSFHFKHIFH